MTNEARKVTLWTSIHSDRTGLDDVDLPVSLSKEVIEKIQSAFVEKTEQQNDYIPSPSVEEVSLARIFG